MEQVDLIEAFRRDLELRGRAKDTVLQYVRWMEFFAKYYDGDLISVTRDDLRTYLNNLRIEKKFREASIKIAFQAVSSFFDFLVDAKMIAENPIPSFRRRYMNTYKRTNGDRSRQIITIE